MISRKGRPRRSPARIAMDLYCDHPACERRATASVPNAEFEWALPAGWMRMVLRLSSADVPVDVDLCHEHAIPFRQALRGMCEWVEERPAQDIPIRGQRGKGVGGRAKRSKKDGDVMDLEAAAGADVHFTPPDLTSELTQARGGMSATTSPRPARQSERTVPPCGPEAAQAGC